MQLVVGCKDSGSSALVMPESGEMKRQKDVQAQQASQAVYCCRAEVFRGLRYFITMN